MKCTIYVTCANLRGYSDIFIYTKARTIFLEFQYFWGLQSNVYFWGMKSLWIPFGGHHKTGLVLGDMSMHFRVFS